MTCGRTKVSVLLNEVLSPFCHDFIVSRCKLHPYSVGTDGSNDTGEEKMNPVCIRIFDIKTSKTISNHFLYMCLTGGEDVAKEYKIFEAIENIFTKMIYLGQTVLVYQSTIAAHHDWSS